MEKSKTGSALNFMNLIFVACCNSTMMLALGKSLKGIKRIGREPDFISLEKFQADTNNFQNLAH